MNYASWVGRIYADQNSSLAVRRSLKQCLSRLRYAELGLQVGSGATLLHPQVLNVDIMYNPKLDCCARAEQLPFRDESFHIVLSQETLEHVEGLPQAIGEMYRVLHVGGTLYCQVPFMIGYHPGPTDFWRFTKEGIRSMFEQAGFTYEDGGIAVGPSVGFYRVAVEYTGVLAARISSRFYLFAKGAAAVLFYPIKLLDSVVASSPQADRIAGGYYVIMRKIIQAPA